MPTPENESWLPYGFALLQTTIVAVLGYISKLLRDIRTDIGDVKMDVGRHDVKIEEAEKREALRAHELERRLEQIEKMRRSD